MSRPAVDHLGLLLLSPLCATACNEASGRTGAGAGRSDTGAARDALAADATISPDASAPRVTDGSNDLVVENGTITIDFSKVTGTYSIVCGGAEYVAGAHASADLGGTTGYVEATSYTAHTFSPGAVSAVHDGFGDGVRIPVESTASGRPTIEQAFTVYPAHPDYFLRAGVNAERADVFLVDAGHDLRVRRPGRHGAARPRALFDRHVSRRMGADARHRLRHRRRHVLRPVH